MYFVILIDFRPIGDIIRNELTVTQKQQLYEHITSTVRTLHPSDVIILLPLITGNESLQQAVFKTVLSFITNEIRTYSI